VTAAALSRDDKQVLDSGTVELIDNQIDQATGTIRVKSIMPNREQRLWPGQFVNVRVQTQLRRQVLTIPAAALERGPEGTFTYVVQPDSTVAVALLTTAEQQGNIVVVESGLTAGQRVVTSNQYRLQPGALVRVNAPTVAGTPAEQAAKPAP
jgi:multidrug efflux system membrane fusion protein